MFKKIDQEVKTALRETFNMEPEAVLYGINTPSFLMMMLLNGALFLWLQKPYMLGISGDKLCMIRTSIWSTKKLIREDKRMLNKADIKSASVKKFGFVRYITAELQDGSKFKLVANTKFIGLEGQEAGLSALLTWMGAQA